MGKRASLGFTIIETVLFLGVTGLLVMGVLIGVGTNVNVQRYRDATETFKSTIQSQYADVLNVQNGRSQEFACNSAAGIIDTPTGELPGQSDCMVIGKYVRIEQSTIESYTVLARERFGVTPSDTQDITMLREAYTINISRAEVTTKTMEWGTEIARPIVGGVTNNRTPHTLGLLIVRSPDSGQVYTFASNDIPTAQEIEDLDVSAPPAFIASMIIAGNTTPGQAEQTLCIESSGLFDNGQMALLIAPFASSSSAIELVSNDTLEARGSEASC